MNAIKEHLGGGLFVELINGILIVTSEFRGEPTRTLTITIGEFDKLAEFIAAAKERNKWTTN